MSEGRILVVDDEAHIRELVRLYLGKEDFKVTAAADGEEALRNQRYYLCNASTYFHTQT